MKKALCFCVMALVSTSAIATASADGVTFYQDIYYSGPSTAPIPPGEYLLADLETYGFQNDWASSVSIPYGCAVELYSDDGFGGDAWMLDRMDFNSEDFRNFGGSDVVSSVKIRCAADGVTFYQDIYYSGPSTAPIPPGEHLLADLETYGFQNDWASSVGIPDGLAVDLYSDDNFGGDVWTLDRMDFNSEDFGNFGGSDVISSVRVRRTGQ